MFTKRSNTDKDLVIDNTDLNTIKPELSHIYIYSVGCLIFCFQLSLNFICEYISLSFSVKVQSACSPSCAKKPIDPLVNCSKSVIYIQHFRPLEI